ncbi:MAG: ribbon-helix-helix domain-containing protein [Candidatus Njordarchaeota archaeon]
MRMEMISVRIDKKLIETIDKIVANSDKWPDRASFIREAIRYQLKAIPKKRIELKKIHEKALGPNKIRGIPSQEKRDKDQANPKRSVGTGCQVNRYTDRRINTHLGEN